MTPSDYFSTSNSAKARKILTLNAGSSSLKIACFQIGAKDELRVFAGEARSIGDRGSSLLIRENGSNASTRRDTPLLDHRDAFTKLLNMVTPESIAGLDAIGHRIVHGGAKHERPENVSAALLSEIQELEAIAPLHNPPGLRGIEMAANVFPEVPQVACFDTAFHRKMPEVAQRLPLPDKYWVEGVRRFGFHGLSYEFVLQSLGAEGSGRLIIAHLGSGASLAAIRDGKPIDTTMGLTPMGGVMMGTRTGDLDPGVLIYLLRKRNFTADRLDCLLERESGLLGVSGSSASMIELLNIQERDSRAAIAIQLFVYQIRKSIGSLAAALGGVDSLVFTGGIGEHAAPIRESVCEGLGFLGINLDRARNLAHARQVSADSARCRVLVIPTDEELMIARHTLDVVTQRKVEDQ